MSITRRSILIGLGLAGLPIAPARAAAATQAGNVVTTTGQSSGQLGAARRALAAGAPVFIDETLSTAAEARLSVLLGAATRLSLGEKTRIRIDRILVDRGGELTLGRGAMLFDRPSDTPSAPLAVTTPFGLIAARGTKFFAGPSNGVFGVFVEHGLVTVSTRAGSVMLTAGQGTNLVGSRIPPSPPKPWGPPRIAAALASVT
jgi:ferric-dicitrate binding protein FerR (iron transport regulator)